MTTQAPFFSPILPHTPPIPMYSPVAANSPALPLNSNLIIRSISPPTPAPSPQPHLDIETIRARYSTAGLNGVNGNSNQDIEQKRRSNWSPTTERDHWGDENFQLDRIRREFSGMSSANRQRLLETLIFDSSPAALSPLLPLIIPRLKRDFLKTLPIELAFHVLCFVDNVKTLARASGVSRFWRGLLEDESTWKRMCWKSGFGDSEEEGNRLKSGEKTAGERMRSLEFGEREEEIGTPAGRERRGTLDRSSLTEFAARAELFGLRPVEEEVTSRASWFQSLPTEANDSTEDWGAWGATGLGFGGGITSLAHDSVEARRARTNAARQARNSEISPPLPTTPQQPVPIQDLIQVEVDSNSSPVSRNRQRSMPPLETSVSPTILDAVLLPAYRSPLSFSASPSTSASAPISRTISPGGLTVDTSKKPFSYKTHFKRAYLTESNWLRGPGRILSAQISHDDGVVTSLGFDGEWIAVGMATSKVHIFKASNGDYYKTLEGHELGVWCLVLVSTGGGPREERKGKAKSKNQETDGTFKDINVNYPLNPRRQPANSNSRLFTNDSPTARSPFFRHPRPTTIDLEEAPTFITPPRRRRSFQSFDEASPNSNSEREEEGTRTGGMGLGAGGETGDSSQQAGVCGTARGYGREGALVVSGGCDRDVRVWDVKSGSCVHVLRGHTSTVRCLRVIDGRPIAISGSRDTNLRVWDIEKGVQMHLLAGHDNSVRCIEVNGNKVVSGSYDSTCRLWDVDTGECLFVFRGHFHQIYAVAFDGVRVVTGSLDSTVRIWSATTGEPIALLQGHTSLVGQLQMDPISNVLVTGGSDGRVIVFSLDTFECIHRLCAHDNSVTCLQFDDRFIVTGGNDGRIKLWDFKTGNFIRELAEGCEAIWRVVFRDDKCVILYRKEGRTVMEVKTFRPSEGELGV